ncbi:Crp/Fnr family transcriptional regulator [Mucilaginibacter sp. RS28]|uniref:Crp/Fnr family transcriptional regulator n=1 Tax=Mucilaginibacter straminoryzae TaxID=2932774 RepID=A0A9X2BB68_9SPHI|nr:Crp/Fnr family transcriptional regulator [Mucilaginibacter straminoryzae]MCJ8211500.1 Crp/Fnr family transcriptional regulator [Mucilaginibacter straminoryzae]
MFSNALTTTGTYSAREIQLFEKEVTHRQVQKGTVLLSKGEICKSLFFLLQGAVHQYEFNSASDLRVVDLHTANEWFLNHQSFVSQTPSEHAIAAFTDIEIFEISIESIHYLIAQSSAFLQLNKILAFPASRLHLFDNALTPLQKYQFIFEHRPQLLQAFPLKMIASFLKITPETLSRVREKFAKAI